MSQPLNFRNSANTSTFATITASAGDSTLTNSGIIDITGKTTSNPCFLKNGRLLPAIDTTNNTTLTINISTNNNHHITTNANISEINITNPVIGQSGHIILKNSDANTHSITWKLSNQTSYIKWRDGTAPTLSTTANSYDIISYYCYSTTEILMCDSVGHS